MALHPGMLLPRAQGGEQNSAAEQRGWVGGPGEAFAPCPMNKSQCKRCHCRNSKQKRGLGLVFPVAPTLLPAPRPLTSPASPPLPAAIPRASILPEQGLGVPLPCMHLHTYTHACAHAFWLHMDTPLDASPVALLLLEGARHQGVVLHMQTPEIIKRKQVMNTSDSSLGHFLKYPG